MERKLKNVFKKVSSYQTLCIVTFLTSSFCSLVQAASLQVSPILVEFSSNEKAKELWLTNTGKTNIRAQVRMQEWTQLNSQEVLKSTKKLIASPLITEIKPGQRQLVRLIKPTNINSTQEQAFRMLVDELPGSNPEQNNSGLNILLQYSIPVFYKAPQPPKTAQGLTSLDNIQFKYSNGQISIINRSSAYLRLSQFSYISTTGKTIPLIPGLMGYVLAGQTMSWNLPVSLPDSGAGKFQAMINSDIKQQTLPVQK